MIGGCLLPARLARGVDRGAFECRLRGERSHPQVARQQLGTLQQVDGAELVSRAAAGQQRAGEFEQAARDPGRRLRARVRLQCVLEMSNGVIALGPASQRAVRGSARPRPGSRRRGRRGCRGRRAAGAARRSAAPGARLRAARRPRRRAPRRCARRRSASARRRRSRRRGRGTRARARARPASAMNSARLPFHIAAAPPDSGRVSTSSCTKRSTSAARSAPRPMSFQHQASWTLDAVMPFQLAADSAAASASLASRSASSKRPCMSARMGCSPATQDR